MIKGSIVALVTPMLENGDLDWGKLGQLVDWHINQETNAIVAMGTTGESATLDFDEHIKVVDFIVKRAAGRIPIIAGTGANATSEAIRLTQQASDVGADACLLVTPYYNKPTQSGLVAHFEAIANSVNIPQILYNVPGRTACDMLPPTVAKLATHPNIIGIKEATGDLGRAKAIIAQVPSDFLLYSGDDATAMDCMLIGGRGNISVTANIAPKKISELCRYAISGDRRSAERINGTFEEINRLLFIESNPIPVKWALCRMGKIEKGIRLPLTPLSGEHEDKVEVALDALGLLSNELVS